jgi:hypothetical protein
MPTADRPPGLPGDGGDPVADEAKRPGRGQGADVLEIKRVASAVGEGAMAASLVHSFLAAA